MLSFAKLADTDFFCNTSMCICIHANMNIDI